jgi:hypothetical protein
LPSRHFSDANGLRFEFADRRVDGREQVRVRGLPDQFVIVIRHRHFDAVQMPLVRET